MLTSGTIALLLTCLRLGTTPKVEQAVVDASAVDAAVSPVVYEIVIQAAVDALPEPLHGFFAASLESLRENALPVVAGVSTDADRRTEAAAHYIFLDANAVQDSSGRRVASERFPRDRREAQKLFKRLGIKAGGSLPWTLLDHHQALTQAWKNRDRDKIIQEAGRVLHFAADAAMPHKTSDPAGIRAVDHVHGRNLQNRSEKSAPDWTSGSCLAGPVERWRTRWAFEVRVWPERTVALTHPIEAIFGTLLEAHELIETYGKRSAKSSETSDGSMGQPQSKGLAPLDVLGKMSDRCTDRIESRLEAGAWLGARLVFSAWVQAGRPNVSHAKTTGLKRNRGDVNPSPLAPFVGSRHSSIYHHANCRHAMRIKPGNRISFGSRREAEADGRTPCRVCRPEDE